MSDAFSDLEKQKRDEVERWRILAKERFVSELTTKEMVDELCKREGVTNYRENYPSVKCTIIVVRG